MKAQTIPVELPENALKLAEERGISKEKLGEILKEFALLEIVSNAGKLDVRQAEKLSDDMKAVSWKKTKARLKV